MSALVIIFWIAVAAVALAFAGYPLLIFTLARLRPSPPGKADPARWPTVTCLVVARNEADQIAPRIQNLLASDYPHDVIEVVLVSDGSTDGTVEKAQAVGDARVKVVALPAPVGKAAGLNAGLAAARGEIVVLADARQRFAPDAVRQLVRNFSDPLVGAASGNYSIDPSAGGVGQGVDAYWRLEKAIRHAESRHDSSVGCTGAIYALRRELFRPVPPDTILDDVVIPMQVAAQGKRVVFDPAACSFDPLTVVAGREFKRKRRTLAGNFQMLFSYPGWLLPWRHRLWWQILGHKYARLAAPAFLAAMFGANLALAQEPLYLGLLAGQVVFYLAAVLGMLFPRAGLRVLSLPAGFVFLNFTIVAGCWHYLTGASAAGWEKSGSGAPPLP